MTTTTTFGSIRVSPMTYRIPLAFSRPTMVLAAAIALPNIASAQTPTPPPPLQPLPAPTAAPAPLAPRGRPRPLPLPRIHPPGSPAIPHPLPLPPATLLSPLPPATRLLSPLPPVTSSQPAPPGYQQPGYPPPAGYRQPGYPPPPGYGPPGGYYVEPPLPPPPKRSELKMSIRLDALDLLFGTLGGELEYAFAGPVSIGIGPQFIFADSRQK